MSPVSRATRRQSRATAAPTSTAGRPKTTAQRARPVASAAPVVAVELAVRNGANEDEMEVIPADYVADKLTELGSTFFDSAMGANCKLVVECENGTFRSYWGHELFLAWKSGYFRAVFSALHARAAATAGQESKTTSEYSNDEETAPAVWPVIRVPVSNANFEEMLYWVSEPLTL
ncbi:hypothetical protein BC938DRAFT_473904 [Jimgerdemannia flammicorona]|uniref:BTB domain-containing protein n=1 Tax=Jimgerdemannia flammicorona TaxID=994334 RepID=A0A433Q3A8_9FUNG|nr:hypothetical protein BC938DRAFT_473904 [Jimgerdemannia flammicorona]